MKNNIKGILLEEINRSRKIMGLSLLTEGTIYDNIADFFFRVGKSSADDLTTEEREMFNKLVSNSTSLQTAGIRSINDLLDPALKKVFLNTLSSSRDNILNAFTKSIDDYVSDAVSKIRNNLSFDLTNLVRTTPVSNKGSVLDLIKDIESDGISTLKPQTLTLLKSELEQLKLNPLISADPTSRRYISEMISEIDDNILLRQIDFGKKIDDLSLVGTTTSRSFDEILADVGAKFGQKVNVNDEYVKSVKKLFDGGADSNKIVSNLETYITNLERRSKDNTLSSTQRKESQDKLNHVLSVMGKIGGVAKTAGEETSGFIANFFKKWSRGDKSTGWGIFNFMLALGFGAGAMWGGDDLVYLVKSESGNTNYCLDLISGYESAILDPGWFFSGPIEQFMEVSYPKEDVCYNGSKIPNKDQITEFKLLKKDEDKITGYDNYDILVNYKEGCTDTIEIRTDMYKNWILGFKDKVQKCGPRKGSKVEDESSAETGSGEEEKKTEEPIVNENPDITTFKQYIINDWGSGNITNNETYFMEDGYYVVNDGSTSYRYEYIGNKKFKQVNYE